MILWWNKAQGLQQFHLLYGSLTHADRTKCQQHGVRSLCEDQHLIWTDSTVSKYPWEQLAEECFSAGEKSSGSFDSIPCFGSEQLPHAAYSAPDLSLSILPIGFISLDITSVLPFPHCPMFIIFSLFIQLISKFQLSPTVKQLLCLQFWIPPLPPSFLPCLQPFFPLRLLVQFASLCRKVSTHNLCSHQSAAPISFLREMDSSFLI